MNYTTSALIDQLKAKRQQAKMSQRQLSEYTCIPQSQISKIEQQEVDIRLSTLISSSHALGLDVILAPGKALTAVKLVIRHIENPGNIDDLLHDLSNRPMYQLDDDD